MDRPGIDRPPCRRSARPAFVWLAFVWLAFVWLAFVWLAATAPAVAEATAAEQSCVDVQIGVQRFYDCLNRRLRQSVPSPPVQANDTANPAGISAPAAGTYNHAATQQRLGTAFGHSVVPQRPPPPIYANPMMPPGSR